MRTLCLLPTAEGHRVLYDREVPFEIRNQTDPHDSAQEVRPRPQLLTVPRTFFWKYLPSGSHELVFMSVDDDSAENF
jgi:hypothetical protein